MDGWDLYQYLSDICPSVEIFEGSVFLNRSNLSKEALLENIQQYESTLEAQRWINMVPVNDFLSSVISDWSLENTYVPLIMDLYSKSWLSICANAGINIDLLQICCLKDEENGDLIFQLRQNYVPGQNIINADCQRF